MANNSQDSYRLMFRFWLDMVKPEEESIADIIEKLKSAKRYTAAIRDGLRLVWDLSQGKTDVLLELFPFVKTALAGDGGSNDGVSKEDIARLEALILETKDSSGVMSVTPHASGLKPMGGVKQLQAPQFAAPVFDEDDEDLVLPVGKASGDGQDAIKNFLSSMAALQH